MIIQDGMLMLNCKSKTNSTGFTLIEFMIYMVIGSMVVGIMSMQSLDIIYGGIKRQTISEVTYNAHLILDAFEDISRNAESFSFPQNNSTSTTIVFEFLDGALNPTILFVDDGVLYVSRGTDSLVPVTTQTVQVSSLEIIDISVEDSLYAFSVYVYVEGRNDSH